MAPTAGTRLRMQKAQARKPHRGQAKKIPSLKNRIRAIERFLKRGEIPDATRRAKKAELAQLQQEHEAKERVEHEKANAEKYKKPRFFERVKIMRKLRQVKRRMESAADDAEKERCQAEYERVREDMMYIYFYPRGEPYLSLLPAKPLSDAELQRQQELREAAVTRFEGEQPTEAFHQFCFNDGKAAEPQPAAALLVKRPTKEEAKKHKKPRKKRDKTETAAAEPVLADVEDADLDGASAARKKRKKAKQEAERAMEQAADEEKEEEEEEEEEEDDFFL